MRYSFRRSLLDRTLTVVACLALAAAACSPPAQEATSPAGSGTAAAGQVEAMAAAAPAAAAGQAAANAPSAAPPAPEAAPPPPPPPPPPPRTFTLAAGTVLAVRTSATLSTDRQSAGDRFEATLAEPIVAGDWVIAKEGAAVDGLVVESTKGGRVKGTAQMAVAITAVTLADGQRIQIQTAMASSAAKSEKKKDVGKVAIATGAGALIGGIAAGGKGAAIGAGVGGAGGTAMVLGTRGKPAEIPARSQLRFEVTKPVEITEQK